MFSRPLPVAVSACALMAPVSRSTHRLRSRCGFALVEIVLGVAGVSVLVLGLLFVLGAESSPLGRFHPLAVGTAVPVVRGRPIYGLAVESSGRRGWTGHFDRRIEYWDLEQGVRLGSYSDDEPTAGLHLISLAASADGNVLLASFSSGTIRLFTGFEGSSPEIHDWKVHESDISASWVSPDGRRGIVGNSDGGFQVLDLQQRRPVTEWRTPHTDDIRTIDVSHDGQRMLTAGCDGLLRVAELDSGRELFRCEPHGGLPVEGAAFSHDGRTVFSGGRDNGLVATDTVTGETVWSVPESHAGWVASLVISHDGRTLATGGFDQAIHLWDAATGERLAHLEGHFDTVRRLAFSQDGRTLVSAAWDGTTIVWDVATRTPRRTLQSPVRP